MAVNLESNNFTPKTEEELLKSLGLGVTRQTIQNYKSLTGMIPELEELVDTGIAAWRCWWVSEEGWIEN